MTFFPLIIFGFLSSFIILCVSNELNPSHSFYVNGSETKNEIDTSKIYNTNKSIIFLVDKNRTSDFQLPKSLEDPAKSCTTSFKCTVTFSTGWKDNSSFKVSTENNTSGHWSTILGQEFPVNTNDRFEIQSHMKMDKFVQGSNILFEGFNETSGSWNAILKCPYDVNGPIQWTQFRCSIAIDPHITKIRPVFNAGWSAAKNREAATWFDYLNMTKFNAFIEDANLKFEVVYKGLISPTNMAFLGKDDFLVLERNGNVHRIVDGVKSTKPLLSFHVAKYEDGGLLGIAVHNSDKNSKPNSEDKLIYVYLYLSEQLKPDQGQQKESTANRVYRYVYENNTLKNGTLLLDLPAGYHHDGGPILVGPDNQSLYLSIGDIENQHYSVVPNKALNNISGLEPDGTAGILRFTLDGKPVNGGILGNKYPLNLYYAYGIRNSFGMAFDPITGKLWGTENSHETGDEINLLEPGFNGGWNKVQGVWPFLGAFVPNASYATYNPPDLVTFEGRGKYSSPEFVWNRTVGPTGLTFMTTDKLGKQYKNEMFVSDVENGRIYHFELNQSRTGLLLEGALKDKIADNDIELKHVIFAGNFGLITDLEIGPDGYLYFVVFNEGSIYRIVPKDQNFQYAGFSSNT